MILKSVQHRFYAIMLVKLEYKTVNKDIIKTTTVLSGVSAADPESGVVGAPCMAVNAFAIHVVSSVPSSACVVASTGEIGVSVFTVVIVTPEVADFALDCTFAAVDGGGKVDNDVECFSVGVIQEEDIPADSLSKILLDVDGVGSVFVVMTCSVDNRENVFFNAALVVEDVGVNSVFNSVSFASITDIVSCVCSIEDPVCIGSW